MPRRPRPETPVSDPTQTPDTTAPETPAEPPKKRRRKASADRDAIAALEPPLPAFVGSTPTLPAAEWCDPRSLSPWDKNPRRNEKAIPRVKESILRFGFGAPVVARRENREVIAGHTRIAAVLSLLSELEERRTPAERARLIRDRNLAFVPVRFLDIDEKDAHLLALADNKLGEVATWDDERLAAVLSSYRDLDVNNAKVAGFADAEIDRLVRSLQLWVNPDEQDITPPSKPETKDGELFELGPHRLLCGDSLNPESWVRLLRGEQADMIWSDPPYCVSYVGGPHPMSPEQRRKVGGLVVPNDDLDEKALGEMFSVLFGNAFDHCKKGGAWYITAPAGPRMMSVCIVLRRLDVWRQKLEWVKDSLVLGRTDYHYRSEPMFYGWKPGAAHYFAGARDQDSIWEIPRPKRSKEHPTMKPIELVARSIRNSTRRGELVVDMCGGSGTTLLAAHAEGRRAYLIEKDPGYCDVIRRRFAEVQAAGFVT